MIPPILSRSARRITMEICVDKLTPALPQAPPCCLGEPSAWSWR